MCRYSAGINMHLFSADTHTGDYTKEAGTSRGALNRGTRVYYCVWLETHGHYVIGGVALGDFFAVWLGVTRA